MFGALIASIKQLTRKPRCNLGPPSIAPGHSARSSRASRGVVTFPSFTWQPLLVAVTTTMGFQRFIARRLLTQEEKLRRRTNVRCWPMLRWRVRRNLCTIWGVTRCNMLCRESHGVCGGPLFGNNEDHRYEDKHVDSLLHDVPDLLQQLSVLLSVTISASRARCSPSCCSIRRDRTSGLFGG